MPDSALDPKRIEPPTRFRSPLTSPEAAQWRIGFWRNVRDFLAAPARSPRIASASGDATSTQAWRAAGHLTRAQTISLAFHGSLIVLLLIPAAMPPPDVLGYSGAQLIFAGVPPGPKSGEAEKDTGGGGSGAHERNPARAGTIPPFARWQFTPPNDNVERKALMAPPTLIGPDFSRTVLLPFGDPTSNGPMDSRGPGSGGSFGDGDGTGAGPGKGPGLGPGEGGWRGGGRRIRHGGGEGAGMPVCAYCPNPTFTDEAVKTKYQGSVVLRLVVTEDGRAAHISVVRGIGMGLDERALEAVKTWRFQPARGPNGRPEAVWVTVEVMFRQF